MPKVSVIIPTYNRASYICETIDSVLDQTFTDYEIIVVDDGSTDNTKEIVSLHIEKYSKKIRYFYQENRGEAGARNTGIKESKGEYIAFLDSDDIWHREKLEKQIKALEGSDVSLVYCSMYIIKDGYVNYKKRKPSSPALNFHDLLLGGKSIPMTGLVKKNDLDKVGLFDESIKLACDYDMWLRFSMKYKIKFMNEPLAFYRRHASNISRDLGAVKICGIKIFNKMLSNNTGIPKKLLKSKLSREYYGLGKIYYDKGEFKSAILQVYNAIVSFPLVGLTFISSSESLRNKIYIFAKPYLFLSYLLILCLLRGKASLKDKGSIKCQKLA